MLVRTLLVWLVLLAVPFQGFAAAAMTCAHGMASSSAKHAAKHEAKAPCHGDAAANAAADDDGAGGPQHKKCGNCAACSVGTAMAPASSPAAPDCCPCSCCPAAASARVSASDPDLPERPPRHALA
ncbi:conserved exported hypothetical protein [Massilia sp. 9I]|nr:conserved exported hypothetical protein [Massilia sp. 9I]